MQHHNYSQVHFNVRFTQNSLRHHKNAILKYFSHILKLHANTYSSQHKLLQYIFIRAVFCLTYVPIPLTSAVSLIHTPHNNSNDNYSITIITNTIITVTEKNSWKHANYQKKSKFLVQTKTSSSNLQSNHECSFSFKSKLGNSNNQSHWHALKFKWPGLLMTCKIICAIQGVPA